MTYLLEQAIAQVKTLPTDIQDAIASRLLTELSDEKTWQSQFENTTENQWDNIAEMVRKEITAGDVMSADEAFKI